MLSKAVSRREASDRYVLSAIKTHGPAAAAEVVKELAQFVQPGESVPDIAFVLVLAGRSLVHHSGTMTAADQANTAELADDGPARDERDEAAAALSRLVIKVRMHATAQFGQDFGKDLGVSGDTPRDADGLRSFAAKFIQAIERTEFPAVTDEDDDDEVASFDKPKALAKLRRALARLVASLENVDTEKRELDATLVEKDRHIAGRDATFGFAATLTSLILERAGQPELAAKVRPSASRPAETAELPDATPAEGTP